MTLAKRLLQYHVVDRFSVLDAVVLLLASKLAGSDRYVDALVFLVVGIILSAVVAVLVERMK